MFINPKIALENEWIQGIKNPEKQIQPNAIDFTADKAFEVNDKVFYLSEDMKEMRGGTLLNPCRAYYEPEAQDAWIIAGGDMLDFLSEIHVHLPEGVAAQLVIRSTLARNGLMLVSGLYDSGFEGHIGFLLHNRHKRSAVIAPGTRVGQIIFIEASSAGKYAGGYNHAAGTDLEYQGGS